MDRHQVIIVDDHQLISDSLKRLIESFKNFEVSHQLSNGQKLLDHLAGVEAQPDIILLDMNMPILDGKATMKKLQENDSKVNVLVLSMDDSEESILYMIRHGAKGYILKDTNPKEFKTALEEVVNKGFYHSERLNSILLGEIVNPNADKKNLSERELEFIQLVCTDKTYKEIAKSMFLSPKTIDGYRENLFKKLGVKNRVGLVLHAIKNDWVKL